MRILFLTERYPPHRLGGYEVACAAVAEGLRKRGHDVVILTTCFGIAQPRREGHVHRVLHQPNSPSLTELGRWELNDLAALRSYRAFKPQVVYAWGVAELFGSLWRVIREEGWPTVHNVQDVHVLRQVEAGERRWALWTKPGANPLRGLVKALLRRALLVRDDAALRPLRVEEACLDHLVFCSRFIRGHHVDNGLPLRDHRIIYNGVDTRHFSPPTSPRRSESLRLLFVGRLHEEKGLHVALDAMERLVARGRKASLDIYAVPAHPFDYEESLRARASANLAGIVTFHEPVQTERLPDVYRSHDALLFPSARLEGLPMVLVESMACALPALSTAKGGSAELAVDGVSALTIGPEDPVALADAVERIDDDRDLLARLSRGAARLIQQTCDLDAIVSQTEDYLQNVSRGLQTDE